jgi:hypothetical protein
MTHFGTPSSPRFTEKEWKQHLIKEKKGHLGDTQSLKVLDI